MLHGMIILEMPIGTTPMSFVTNRAGGPTAVEELADLSLAGMCGEKCKVPGCGRPCRGFAGHDPPHECNNHHTW